jgi:hypothetical protein
VDLQSGSLRHPRYPWRVAMSESPAQLNHRLQLYNYLAHHGGSGRLEWELRSDGPPHNLTWHAIANSAHRSCDAFCLICVVTDGVMSFVPKSTEQFSVVVMEARRGSRKTWLLVRRLRRSPLGVFDVSGKYFFVFIETLKCDSLPFSGKVSCVVLMTSTL